MFIFRFLKKIRSEVGESTQTNFTKTPNFLKVLIIIYFLSTKLPNFKGQLICSWEWITIVFNSQSTIWYHQCSQCSVSLTDNGSLTCPHMAAAPGFQSFMWLLRLKMTKFCGFWDQAQRDETDIHLNHMSLKKTEGRQEDFLKCECLLRWSVWAARGSQS